MAAASNPAGAAGLENARDLGGLAAAGGRRVVGGRLIRAAAPDFRDPATHAAIARLELARVCDFRMNDEIRGSGWSEAYPSIVIWRPTARPVHGDPQALLAACLADGADPTAIMTGIYRRLPDVVAEHIAATARALGETGGPVLFHCAAGKDRTGAAAAALLSIAGVSRDDIYADYLRSNAAEGALVARYLADPRNDAARAAPYARWRALMIADPCYLDAYFDEIDRRWGGVEGYATRGLGLAPAEIIRLRSALLDPI